MSSTSTTSAVAAGSPASSPTKASPASSSSFSNPAVAAPSPAPTSTKASPASSASPAATFPSASARHWTRDPDWQCATVPSDFDPMEWSTNWCYLMDLDGMDMREDYLGYGRRLEHETEETARKQKEEEAKRAAKEAEEEAIRAFEEKQAALDAFDFDAVLGESKAALFTGEEEDESESDSDGEAGPSTSTST
ncbi:hypothetical protein EG329_003974 [Mollisiaceae sp. DMI_Dod_QoI]|nr:hypothetical protein EG329_003974 [Helotiales sp. DMI_Dod_QoI]